MHCELVGDPPANGKSTLLSANNIYKGIEKKFAVLAVLKVKIGAPRMEAWNALPDYPVCRAK